jgi:hypothetical protein
VHIEDPGNWAEIPRSQEIQEYSSGVRRLFARSLPGRVISIVGIGFMAYVFIKVVGIGSVGGEVTDAERQVAMEVSIAWAIFFLVIALPIAVYIYRPRMYRVSKKK